MAWPGKASGWCSVVVLWLILMASAVVAQTAPPPEEGTPPEEPAADEPTSLMPHLTWGMEAKANFRNSDENRFRVPFFEFHPNLLPPGQEHGFEETVNAGSHFEVSVLTLLLDAVWGDGLMAHTKIDFIDLYDRNPTSSDQKIDVDEAWMRFGVETEPAQLPSRWGVYLKVGKFPHFERQDDRHLESYGLVSTAFNRFEDIGAEMGASFGRHVYLKLSATQGNPVFLRDPNALAGDNGTPDQDPTLKSGIAILYDAEAEDIDTDGKLEAGAGLGARWADEGGKNGVDVLAWAYKRKLAKRVPLEGSFYGGDLDLLNGPTDHEAPSGFSGDDKEEKGGNVWLYLGGLSFFGQYVDQKLANLPRTGIEGELAWRFDLPLNWAIGDQQLFTFVQPALRYSKLDNKFRNNPQTPAPSFGWDWEKLDYGVRLGIVPGVEVTAEYADNSFILGSGATAHNNEFLSTLRWHM
jgi:hypothetical protein